MRKVFIVVIGIVALSSIAILLTRQAPPVVDLPSPLPPRPSHAIAVHVRDHMAFAGSKPLSSRTAFSIESGRTRQHHDGLMTHGVLWPHERDSSAQRRHGEINRRSCLERVASEDSTLGADVRVVTRHPSSVLIQTTLSVSGHG